MKSKVHAVKDFLKDRPEPRAALAERLALGEIEGVKLSRDLCATDEVARNYPATSDRLRHL